MTTSRAIRLSGLAGMLGGVILVIAVSIYYGLRITSLELATIAVSSAYMTSLTLELISCILILLTLVGLHAHQATKAEKLGFIGFPDSFYWSNARFWQNLCYGLYRSFFRERSTVFIGIQGDKNAFSFKGSCPRNYYVFNYRICLIRYCYPASTHTSTWWCNIINYRWSIDVCPYKSSMWNSNYMAGLRAMEEQEQYFKAAGNINVKFKKYGGK